MSDATKPLTDNTSVLHAEIERLRADLHRVRADMSTLAEDALRATKTGSAEAKERLERVVKSAAEKGRDSVESIEDMIATHPLLTVGVALAVGVAVGLAIPRRS